MERVGTWTERLEQELQSGEYFRDSYRLLGAIPVNDQGTVIHSALIGYLCSLGQEMGFSTVQDAPMLTAPRSDVYLWMVRPDCVWYDVRETEPQAKVAFEVERFKPALRHTLEEKIGNLVIVSHQAPQLKRLVFVYWLLANDPAPDVKHLFRFLYTSFSRDGITVPPPRVPVDVVRCLLWPAPTGLILRSLTVMRNGVD